MRISIIVAVAENGVIGRDGKLPWYLSDDLKRFKQLTMGHTIVMGRRTWESIGHPLRGRRMIVVSRQTGYHVQADGVEVAGGLDAALSVAQATGNDEAFIVGGAELYREALPRADRIYVTRVHANVDGDTLFPISVFSNWRQISSEHHPANPKNDYPFSLEVYER